MQLELSSQPTTTGFDILFVSPTISNHDLSLPVMYRVHTTPNPDTFYDLAILDMNLLGATLAQIVQDIKISNPLIQIVGWNTQYDEALRKIGHVAGISTFIEGDLTEEIQWLLDDSTHPYQPVTPSIQQIAAFINDLQATEQFPALIESFIHQTCNIFDLAGSGIYTNEDVDCLHISWAGEPIQSRSLPEGIDLEKPQVLNKIPLELMPDLEYETSMISVPFQNQRGALLVFGNTLSEEDLPIFNMLATQFAMCSDRLQIHEAKKAVAAPIMVDIQRLSAAPTREDVATTLHILIENLPSVERAVVWLGEGATRPDFKVKTKSQQLMYQNLLSKFKYNRSSLVVEFEPDPLAPLHRLLDANQLLAFPIHAANSILGTIVVSAGINQNDRSYIEVLALASEQVLGRIPVTPSKEQPGYERLLAEVDEAIFIVDDCETVTLCNPRFTKLTGITEHMVCGKPYSVLLNYLADTSGDTQTAQTQFQQITTQPLDQTIDLYTKTNQHFKVQFIMLDGYWAGIIREQATTSASPMIDIILEQMRLPFARVRNTVASLVEDYHHLNQRELSMFLREIECNVEDVNRLWDTLRGISMTHHEAEDVDPVELIEQILSSRDFSRIAQQFHVTISGNTHQLKLKSAEIKQALVSLFQSISDLAPGARPIRIDVQPQDSGINLEIRAQPAIALPDKAFEPQSWFSTPGFSTVGFGFYLSNRLIQQNNGQLWANNEPDQTISIFITLSDIETGQRHSPELCPVQETIVPAQTSTEDKKPVVTGAPERTMQTIMVIWHNEAGPTKWLRKLEAHGYELLVYDSAEAALRDLSVVRFDLILLDAQYGASEARSLETCGWIRTQTQIPVIIINETASENHKIEALRLGADDYIVQSISDEEFLARVNVIFKRQHIATRTQKPLEIGDIVIDFAQRKVSLCGKPVKLTRIQYDLLYVLIINRGNILTHKQLLEKVWGPEYRGETQYLWVNISRLRKKLEVDMSNPTYIQNVPGIGYTFRE